MKKNFLIVLFTLCVFSVSAVNVEPYRTDNVTPASASLSFNMVGDKYTEGYLVNGFNAYTKGTMLYNLRNQYKTMTCTVGPTTRAELSKDFQVDFLVDDVLAQSVVFSGEDFPVDVEIDLNYQSKLTINFLTGYSAGQYAITNIDFKFQVIL